MQEPRGTEDAGALVEKVVLSELNIGPCRACMAWRKAGKCVQQDDMPALLEQMLRSQVWVLGMPVYYGGPTAQFKAFLDRWFGRIYELFETRKGRRGYRELRKRGVSRYLAWNTLKSAHGPWRLSRSPSLALALPASYFAALGVPRLYLTGSPQPNRRGT